MLLHKARALYEKHSLQSARIVDDLGFDYLAIGACNVGIARATGAQALLACGVRWLALMEADSCVAPGWLVAQPAAGADAVCGPVRVDDWSALAPRATRSRHWPPTSGIASRRLCRERPRAWMQCQVRSRSATPLISWRQLSDGKPASLI